MVPVLLPVSSHSKKRTRDDKVDENQGKATGINLRRENARLELQNFFRETKKKISYPTYRFIRISKAKESWALEAGEKCIETSSNSICQREVVSAGLYFVIWRTSHEMQGNNGQL